MKTSQVCETTGWPVDFAITGKKEMGLAAASKVNNLSVYYML